MSQVRLQHGRGSFSVFTILAFTILSLFFLQAVDIAFVQLGIPIWLAIIIIPGSLLGSLINIPLYTIESDSTPCTEAPHVQYWGVSYQVVQPDCPGKTRISINLGGAVIPVAVSTYLIFMNLVAFLQFLIAVTVVTLVVHRVARIQPDVGILTPGFLPALVAVFVTIVLLAVAPGAYNGYAIAYVSGTLGTLIGADILNLGKLSNLRTGSASIGGAGTWDGVFLTGILAVFLL
ncbi:MAG: hypothetical protein C4K48_02575 [Candidatus Thorarchaeota archaeon]|nr:MAG: hypothetical protein C4K48_02575 [Candidatus Thorarchaeota archaeon]